MKSMFVIMVQSSILNLNETAVKAEDKKTITEEEIEPRRDCCYVGGQRTTAGGVSLGPDKKTEKKYYQRLEHYQVNTLHLA